ncbi:hypothetical protein [Nonomuraea sp. NPDC005650]
MSQLMQVETGVLVGQDASAVMAQTGMAGMSAAAGRRAGGV